jgi:hypothetical protein
MAIESKFITNMYARRFIAWAIDLGIELGGGLLGGYFGAMMAALVIVLHEVSPAATQAAIWTGMSFGFLFWGLAVSWVNRVLVQGMSRATFGKKFMDLEIVSTGAPINWESMMKHWISASFIGEIRVVSSLDTSQLAQVYSITDRPSVTEVATTAESSDKKAA